MSLVFKVSLGFAALASHGGADDAQVKRVWDGVQSKIMALRNGPEPKGYAILIDSSGLFLAHESALPSSNCIGSVRGMDYRMNVLAQDARTQLVLLQAQDWVVGERAIQVSRANPARGSKIVAVTLAGPFSADLAADDLVGVQEGTKQYVPFNEIRIETPSRRIGGSWLLNDRGEIVGVICAALQGYQTNSQRVSNQGGTKELAPQNSFGPGDLCVAYSHPVEVLDRVVSGFLSKKHAVRHPEMGMEFQDNPGGNVLVSGITLRGPAHMGGVRAGDIIVSLNGVPMRRATQLAAYLFRQTPSTTVRVKLVRGQEVRELTVTLGEAHDGVIATAGSR